MHFLITNLGSYGDLFPFVGLGARLRQRGHRVTLFTNPHFEALAREHGLAFVRVGNEEQYERFATHPDLFDARRGVQVLLDNLIVPAIRPSYQALAAHASAGESCLIAGPLVPAARVLQEERGLPLATAHIAPMAFKSAYAMPHTGYLRLPDWSPNVLRALFWWLADRAVTDPKLGPPLNALRREVGLPPVKRILSRWVNSPQCVLGLFPGWYAAPQPDWPANTHLVGFPLFDAGDSDPLPRAVQRFLDAGEPPIVFMPGSLMTQGEHMFRTSVRACQELGCRGLLLSRYAHQVPNQLPPTVRHFRYVPFSRLLPRARALVHHGGIGTTAQALRAGVPQLVHPMAYDQYDNAARLEELGVGATLSPAAYEVPAVAEALRTLTTAPAVQAQCQTLAARFQGVDALGDAADIVESLAGITGA